MDAWPHLLESLRSELRAHTGWGGVPLEGLLDKGLAHHHVRLCGTGLLARIPKQSQLGLSPEANLAHQKACFERAVASRHSPRLSMVLPPSAGLPRGALLVEEIAGAAATLPSALAPIARALGAIHALPLPQSEERPPLPAPADPLRALVEEISAQARHVPAAGLEPEADASLERELARLQRLVCRSDRPPLHLIAFDAHPGNFVLRPSGDAVLVDLEKCRYGYAGLDLAHATLYTSTTWDLAAQATLSLPEVRAFYEAWSEAVPAGTGAAARLWHVPLRHAMWLWSLTWCCKWRALSNRPPQQAEAGEDWSAANSDAALVAHVRNRVDHYLSPPAMARVLQELRLLEAELAT